jgi:hypothetical protein
MKTIKLILAGAMVVGAIAVHAQDSTNVATPPAAPTQDQTQQDQMNYKKDMTVIQSSEVPSSLRTTLQGDQYKGWENGTIYRNGTNDMYMIEMHDGDKTKMFRFDKNGKPVKDY